MRAGAICSGWERSWEAGQVLLYLLSCTLNPTGAGVVVQAGHPKTQDEGQKYLELKAGWDM